MAALARMFGGSGKKGVTPTPQMAIQKLRETEEMLSKKSEFLEKKISKELADAKRHGMNNKRGMSFNDIDKDILLFMTLYTVLSSWVFKICFHSFSF